jgi:hypothetical protein
MICLVRIYLLMLLIKLHLNGFLFLARKIWKDHNIHVFPFLFYGKYIVLQILNQAQTIDKIYLHWNSHRSIYNQEVFVSWTKPPQGWFKVNPGGLPLLAPLLVVLVAFVRDLHIQQSLLRLNWFLFYCLSWTSDFKVWN